MRAKINNTLLRVQPSGVKSYVIRYRIRGKQTRFVIGRTAELLEPVASAVFGARTGG